MLEFSKAAAQYRGPVWFFKLGTSAGRILSHPEVRVLDRIERGEGGLAMTLGKRISRRGLHNRSNSRGKCMQRNSLKALSQRSLMRVVSAAVGRRESPIRTWRLLVGEPSAARPIRHAWEFGAVDNVIISTDSERIADAARAAGAEVPFLRPAELADDLSTTEFALQHAITRIRTAHRPQL